MTPGGSDGVVTIHMQTRLQGIVQGAFALEESQILSGGGHDSHIIGFIAPFTNVVQGHYPISWFMSIEFKGRSHSTSSASINRQLCI